MPSKVILGLQSATTHALLPRCNEVNRLALPWVFHHVVLPFHRLNTNAALPFETKGVFLVVSLQISELKISQILYNRVTGKRPLGHPRNQQDVAHLRSKD